MATCYTDENPFRFMNSPGPKRQPLEGKYFHLVVPCEQWNGYRNNSEFILRRISKRQRTKRWSKRKVRRVNRTSRVIFPELIITRPNHYFVGKRGSGMTSTLPWWIYNPPRVFPQENE